MRVRWVQVKAAVELPRFAREACLVLVLAACNRSTNRAEGDARAPPERPCPDEMALVTFDAGTVCIDRYEGAIDGWPYSHPLDGQDAGAMRAIPAKGTKPQVNISEEQAQTACVASSKRLCTSREWLGACRGPKDFVYPYGDKLIDGACNLGRPRPAAAVHETAGGRLDDPAIAEADHAIERGGAFPKCVSAFGVFDLHGNVHEWVSDSPNPNDPRFGEFRGGFFADGVENGAGCLYQTTAHFKSYHDYSTGFRCCKDARRPE